MTETKALQTVALAVPGQNLDSYMQSVNAIPVLTVEQERELGLRLQEDDDLDAARQMVLAHLRFVVHIARSYQGYGLPLGDLIQEGNVGLMKAVKRYDPNKGVRLVSFAVHWIKSEIHEYVIRNWRIVKIATTKAQRKLFFNLRSKKKELARLSLDEAQAVANDLGVTREQVIEMEGRLAAYDSSFDAPVDADDDGAAAYAPAHYLEDHSADPATQLEDADWEENSQQKLMSALQELDERSRDILAARWLSEKKATLHELADRYGVSAERIRQLEANAMKKMKGLVA